MQTHRICRLGHGRNSALCILGIRLGEMFLGENPDTSMRCHLKGKGQPRNATANDDVIKFLHVHRAVLSIKRTGPTCAASNNREPRTAFRTDCNEFASTTST